MKRVLIFGIAAMVGIGLLLGLKRVSFVRPYIEKLGV